MINLNKTVLFLVNGLGIERKDSCSIYNNKLMPNFDKLLNNNFFTTLETNANNYLSAYQIFSTGSNNYPEYSYLEDLLYNEELTKNDNFNRLKEMIKSTNSNFHIFVKITNENVIYQLSEFIKNLKLDNNKTVFVHVILTQNSIELYKNVISNYNLLRFKMPSQVKIGSIFGEEIIDNEMRKNDLISLAKLLFKGFGEKWNEPENKLKSLKMNNKIPREINSFYVSNINLNENDIIFFFNYTNDKYDNLINTIKTPISFVSNDKKLDNLCFISLFPLNTILNIPFIFKKVISPYSISKVLNESNLNALIISDSLNINTINYMVNGLSYNQDNNISYMAVDEKNLNNFNALKSVIDDPKYNLIIINTRIDNLDTVSSIKERLTLIDEIIKKVNDICNNNYDLVLSSLFGIRKLINNEKNEKVNVDFYGKVPMIYITNRYLKTNYYLNSGSIYNLLGTIIKITNPNINYPSLLKKKNFIQKLLKK